MSFHQYLRASLICLWGCPKMYENLAVYKKQYGLTITEKNGPTRRPLRMVGGYFELGVSS
jgi:hypothetical protein